MKIHSTSNSRRVAPGPLYQYSHNSQYSSVSEVGVSDWSGKKY